MSQFDSFKTVPSDIGELAVYVRTRHQEVLTSTSNQLAYAIAAGAGLIAAKENPQLTKHGEFAKFCQKCGIGSQRVCQRYMQLARNRVALEAKAKGSSLFGIEAALRFARSLNRPKPGAENTTAPAPAALPKKIAVAVKTILSLAKVDIGNEHEIAAAARGINRLLGANGLDLHSLQITVAAKKSVRRVA
jgi:hypothetical protein